MNTDIIYDYYFDQDGVLNVFEFGAPKEILFIPGYFLNRPTQENFVEAINKMIDMELEGYPFRVHALSKYLKKNKTALYEKNEWFNQYTPKLTQERRIFLPTDEDKSAHINISSRSVLIDDFGENLIEFQKKGGKIIKVAADAADRRKECKKWPACLSPEQPADQLITNILAFQEYESLYRRDLVW